jgi:Flp pilus assembly protein CpaB
LLRARFAHDLVRAVSRHRRLLAAGLAAAGVAVALHVLQPQEASTTAVLAAARDLPGGARLTGSDVRTVAMPDDLVPSGALTAPNAAGERLLAGPVRAGEPLTDARFVGPDLLPSRGLVAVPVRLADPGERALVRVGDRIDLLAAETDAATAYAPARTVARFVRVLALPAEGSGSVGLGSAPLVGTDGQTAGEAGGGLVVVAVTPAVAADLARAAVTARLSLVLRAG